MKYYLIAGEASGDLHGSNLIKALKELDTCAEFRCWGGDLMVNAGATLVKHYRDLAFMGFAEVLKHLPHILQNFSLCKRDINQYHPDAIILIDYPGFNLRMAKWAKKRGYRVFYYISPQLWAWKSKRIEIIREYVDKLFCILPFEKKFYETYSVEVEYVGHPLMDVIPKHSKSNDFRKQNNLDDRPIIALLPGSRKQEITCMLPLMKGLEPEFPDFQFVIAGANSIDIAFYREYSKLPIVLNQTYDLLHHAHAALVTSGTATLEGALFNVPQVVCYRSSNISYFIARRLANKNLKFISLVNLIAGKRIVRELIQDDLNKESLRREFEFILSDENRQHILSEYAELKKILGSGGASLKTAELINSAIS